MRKSKLWAESSIAPSTVDEDVMIAYDPWNRSLPSKTMKPKLQYFEESIEDFKVNRKSRKIIDTSIGRHTYHSYQGLSHLLIFFTAGFLIISIFNLILFERTSERMAKVESLVRTSQLAIKARANVQDFQKVSPPQGGQKEQIFIRMDSEDRTSFVGSHLRGGGGGHSDPEQLQQSARHPRSLRLLPMNGSRETFTATIATWGLGAASRIGTYARSNFGKSSNRRGAEATTATLSDLTAAAYNKTFKSRNYTALPNFVWQYKLPKSNDIYLEQIPLQVAVSIGKEYTAWDRKRAQVREAALRETGRTPTTDFDKIKQIWIWGERCSCTTAITDLLFKNFNLRCDTIVKSSHSSATSRPGSIKQNPKCIIGGLPWKHDFMRRANLEHQVRGLWVQDETLHILVTRHPYEWLESMRRNSFYAVLHKNLEMEAFLTLQWMSLDMSPDLQPRLESYLRRVPPIRPSGAAPAEQLVERRDDSGQGCRGLHFNRNSNEDFVLTGLPPCFGERVQSLIRGECCHMNRSHHCLLIAGDEENAAHKAALADHQCLQGREFQFACPNSMSLCQIRDRPNSRQADVASVRYFENALHPQQPNQATVHAIHGLPTDFRLPLDSPLKVVPSFRRDPHPKRAGSVGGHHRRSLLTLEWLGSSSSSAHRHAQQSRPKTGRDQVLRATGRSYPIVSERARLASYGITMAPMPHVSVGHADAAMSSRYYARQGAQAAAPTLSKWNNPMRSLQPGWLDSIAGRWAERSYPRPSLPAWPHQGPISHDHGIYSSLGDVKELTSDRDPDSSERFPTVTAMREAKLRDWLSVSAKLAFTHHISCRDFMLEPRRVLKQLQSKFRLKKMPELGIDDWNLGTCVWHFGTCTSRSTNVEDYEQVHKRNYYLNGDFMDAFNQQTLDIANAWLDPELEGKLGYRLFDSIHRAAEPYTKSTRCPVHGTCE